MAKKNKICVCCEREAEVEIKTKGIFNFCNVHGLMDYYKQKVEEGGK